MAGINTKPPTRPDKYNGPFQSGYYKQGFRAWRGGGLLDLFAGKPPQPQNSKLEPCQIQMRKHELPLLCRVKLLNPPKLRPVLHRNLKNVKGYLLMILPLSLVDYTLPNL